MRGFARPRSPDDLAGGSRSRVDPPAGAGGTTRNFRGVAVVVVMATLDFALFWGLIGFGLVVLATYIGASMALRAYFGDEPLSPGDIIRVEPPDDR